MIKNNFYYSQFLLIEVKIFKTVFHACVLFLLMSVLTGSWQDFTDHFIVGLHETL